MAGTGPGHLTAPAAEPADQLPSWAALIRAPNPGPMTLDGTNTWVLRVEPGAPAVVVDPGPLDENHLRAVAATGPVGAVLVTHGHPDHVAGLDRFLAMTGAELLAGGQDMSGPGTGNLATDGGQVDGVPAGAVPGRAEPLPGAARWGLAVRWIRTPGHTADSVCFEVGTETGTEVGTEVGTESGTETGTESGERAMLTGDTILGRGTTVVAWPDGDLGDYLDSLRALSAYRQIRVLPGHGPALADCAAAARAYLTHRQARLDQVRAVVAAGAETLTDVVDRVYGDLAAPLRFAAEWSVRAQLAYLSRESHPAPVRLDQP